jgi:hypothetical protein
MNRKLVCGITLAILFAVPALAGELGGVTMPDEVTVAGKTLVLNGMGLREKFVFDVYVAGLYLEQKTSDPAAILSSDGIVRIHMHFVYKKVSAAKMVEAWNDGFRGNAGDKMASLSEGLDQLNGWMEPLVRGDSMIFTSTPEGLRVEVKGQLRGVVPGADFSRAFWSVFLGPKPPTAPLKTGLLGQG